MNLTPESPDDDLQRLPVFPEPTNQGGPPGPRETGVGQVQDSPLFEVGQLLMEQYELRECIGVGGMGVVYRALDRKSGDEVAVKTLHPRLLGRPSAVEAFLKEARLAMELSHPSIVRTLGVTQVEGTCLIVMELLRGRSLRAEIDANNAIGSTMRLDRTMEIVSAVCQALDHAHQRMVHRDVKPGNIFLCEDGSVKLLDFGIARLTQEEGTTTGTAVGTAYYIAPEFLHGSRVVDHRADQYGLAVTIYEMLTGQVPVGSIRPPKELRAEVSKAMSTAVMRGISPQPNGRYPSIDEFSRALASSRSFKAAAIIALALTVPAAAIFASPLVGGAEEEASQDPQDNPIVAELPDSSPAQFLTLESSLRSIQDRERAINDSLARAMGNSEVDAADVRSWKALQVAMDSVLLAGGMNEDAQFIVTYYREFVSEERPSELAPELLGAARAWSERTLRELENASAIASLKNDLADLSADRLSEADRQIAEGQWTEAASTLKALEQQVRRQTSAAEAIAKLNSESDDLRELIPTEVSDTLDSHQPADLPNYSNADLEELEATIKGVAPVVQEARRQRERLLDSLGSSYSIDGEPQDIDGVLVPTRLTHKLTRVTFLLVPGGLHQWGNFQGTSEQRPEVPVQIEPFYLALTEVTEDQWGKGSSDPPPGATGLETPATGMSHADAMAWCERHGMRLPLESEWEWAAAGSGDSPWPFSTAWEATAVNANGSADGYPELSPALELTTDLGPFGHLGLTANASEWCFDEYTADHGWAIDLPAARPPTSLESAGASGHVIKGGDFRTYAPGCTCAARRPGIEGTARTGFRPAMSIPW